MEVCVKANTYILLKPFCHTKYQFTHLFGIYYLFIFLKTLSIGVMMTIWFVKSMTGKILTSLGTI